MTESSLELGFSVTPVGSGPLQRPPAHREWVDDSGERKVQGMEVGRAAVRDGGPGGSVPVTLRVQLPQCSGAVHGFKLPACMAARVQGSQVALGGPRVGGMQERERERGVSSTPGVAGPKWTTRPEGQG